MWRLVSRRGSFQSGRQKNTPRSSASARGRSFSFSAWHDAQRRPITAAAAIVGAERSDGGEQAVERVAPNAHLWGRRLTAPAGVVQRRPYAEPAR